MTIKVISTMKSGVTSILRINDREMAHFVTEFKRATKYGLELWDAYAKKVVNYNDIKSVRFINEYTHETILEY